jgi:CheY-like chemotaxis protein
MPRGRVLIVEDDEPTCTALEKLLGAEGYTVTSARNGREALARLRETDPCIIVLDYAMPVMDGRAFREAQKANTRWAGIPVVLVTGHHLTSFAARSIDAIAVLQKPVTYEVLGPILERWCGKPSASA